MLDFLADPSTDRRLLPSSLAGRDNARRVLHCKIALRQGLQLCLTPAQREQLTLYYTDGLRKTEIAKRQQCSCSAVCKSMKASLAALRSYTQMYMDIYDALEQEFLQDDQ